MDAPHAAAHVATLADDAPLVAWEYKPFADAHEAAIVGTKVPRITLHGWRHTYATTALKRGDDHQAIKRNLGHAPRSTLLYTTYGSYIDAPRARRGDDA